MAITLINSKFVVQSFFFVRFFGRAYDPYGAVGYRGCVRERWLRESSWTGNFSGQRSNL